MKFLITSFFILFQLASFSQQQFDLAKFEKERVIQKAIAFKNIKVTPLTDFICERSAGGKNDFYSEGDYWWPNPKNSIGPYIRKDGLTNPDNFTSHREVMIQLSQISGALASAYILTKDISYAQHLAPHLQAWFINPNTRMNPNLNYGQAITRKVTGRGIGIIDTIHLMEVALAVKAIENSNSLSQKDLAIIKSWFQSYLKWLTTSDFGIDEKNNGNNHSTCWAMQVAVFAYLIEDTATLQNCKEFYKHTLLPNQMDAKGGFPKELTRTKPYGYSLFNLDAMATLCQILSNDEENLFTYTIKGKSLSLGMGFLYPYIQNKDAWPYIKDVMYWDDWPVKQSSLLFSGLSLNNTDYLETWSELSYDLKNQEIIRNMPVRYPLLWLK